MAIFNIFGEHEHKVFDYKPIYYDKKKDELKQKFGSVDGSKEQEIKQQKEQGTYVPGSYLKGSLRDGNYQQRRTHSSKAQNIIGLVGLILIAISLFYIAKFYTLI